MFCQHLKFVCAVCALLRWWTCWLPTSVVARLVCSVVQVGWSHHDMLQHDFNNT